MTRLRYSLLLLAAGGFVSGMSMRMAEPLLPKVAADLNSTISQASILITSFSLAYGLFQLVHGPLGDRIGKLRAVTGAMALAAIASAACAGAESLADLGWYRFFTGMTAGAVIPLSYAFVGDNIDYAERQPVLGRFIAGTLAVVCLRRRQHRLRRAATGARPIHRRHLARHDLWAATRWRLQ